MSVTAVFVSQTRYNLLASAREGAGIALGVVLPAGLYLLMSGLVGSDNFGGDTPVSVRGAGEVPDIRTFLVGGFMAYAAIYSAFVVLVPALVEIRERGLLKRLRGTPLPLSAFVAARFAVSLLMTTVAVSGIGVLGWAVFDITLRGQALVGLAVCTLASVITFTCLGFATTTVARSRAGAEGLANGVGIVLAMISGVFFDPGILPDTVRTIAQVLPLEPVANSFQSLYATDATGVGLDARNLGILAGWAFAAVAVVAAFGFRWQPRQNR